MTQSLVLFSTFYSKYWKPEEEKHSSRLVPDLQGLNELQYAEPTLPIILTDVIFKHYLRTIHARGYDRCYFTPGGIA